MWYPILTVTEIERQRSCICVPTLHLDINAAIIPGRFLRHRFVRVNFVGRRDHDSTWLATACGACRASRPDIGLSAVPILCWLDNVLLARVVGEFLHILDITAFRWHTYPGAMARAPNCCHAMAIFIVVAATAVVALARFEPALFGE